MECQSHLPDQVDPRLRDVYCRRVVVAGGGLQREDARARPAALHRHRAKVCAVKPQIFKWVD